MPFVLIFIGALFTAAAVNNTQGVLKNTLVGDFTGNNNFSYWALSVVGIGSLGYVKPLKPIVDSFLLLIFLVFVLANRGFFASFNTALGGALTPQPADVAGQSIGAAINNSTIGLGAGQAGARLPGGAESNITNPSSGEIAAYQNLQSFANQGVDTIRGVVNRWMPASARNNAGGYVAQISSATGFAPDQRINLKDPNVYRPILDSLSWLGNANSTDATIYN